MASATRFRVVAQVVGEVGFGLGFLIPVKNRVGRVVAVACALMVLLSISHAVAGTVKLPRTGQTTTYTPEDDGDLQKGETWPQWPDSRFVDHGDGTVTDTFTGLMWTRSVVGPQNDRVAWQAALDYIKGMNTGTNPNLGHTDWRLPSVNEMESLVDYSGNYSVGALPPHHPFTWKIVDNWHCVYWTATSVPGSPNSAYVLRLLDGNISPDGKASHNASLIYSVVPVRTAALP